MMLNAPKVLSVFAASALLIACGGGGGHESGYSCAYIPGNVTTSFVSSACSGCSSSDSAAVADTNQTSFAVIQVGTGQRTTKITDSYSGPSFPAGSKAGALMTLLGSAAINAITFNTYLNGVARDSATGATLTAESTNGTTPAQSYISFPASMEFNSFEIVVNATNSSEYRIYEFCGDS